MDELLEKLGILVGDLIWEYDRMSYFGQQTYDEICSIIAKLMQKEV